MASRRGADAGQDDARRRGAMRPASAVSCGERAEPVEREAQRGDVGAAVGDDRRRRSSHSTPLVLGSSVPSSADGLAQRAADALEAGLDHVVRVVARHADVHARRRACRPASGRSAARARWAGRRPRLATELALEDGVGAAGQVDRHLRLRLVHRQHEAVAARCRACRRAPARRAWPSASAQSSTVWCSSMCRSPLQVSSQREAAVLARAAPACDRRSRCRSRCGSGRSASRFTRRGCRFPSSCARSLARGRASSSRAMAGQVSAGVAVGSARAGPGCRGCARAAGRSRDRRSRRCAARSTVVARR